MPTAPLLHFAAVRTVHMDLLAVTLPRLLMELISLGVICRPQAKSPLSMPERPRLHLEVLFPDALPDLDVLLALQRLRGSWLPADVFYGLSTMFAATDALVLETGGSPSWHHYWRLCSQMVFLDRGRFLVFTSATADTWTSTMDATCQEDSTDVGARLKWKPSRYGGRTVAHTSAVPQALAAARRRGQDNNVHRDFLTDVSILGEVGREDGAVVRRLMDHLIQTAGLQLQETDYAREARLGEYIHLATQDAMHPPGRVRLLLGSRDDVRKVYAALDGQTLQVGQDLVGIAVSNDVEEARGLPGNGRRGRA